MMLEKEAAGPVFEAVVAGAPKYVVAAAQLFQIAKPLKLDRVDELRPKSTHTSH